MLVINPLTLQALKSKLLVVYTCAQVSKRVNFVIDTRVEVSTLRRLLLLQSSILWGAFDSANNHKRQRRKHQSVTAKREKSQTPKFVYVRLGKARLG